VTHGNEGQSIEALSKVAGHASTATTERIYAHVELEKLRIAAQKIANEIGIDMDEELG
jgi:integrase